MSEQEVKLPPLHKMMRTIYQMSWAQGGPNVLKVFLPNDKQVCDCTCGEFREWNQQFKRLCELMGDRTVDQYIAQGGEKNHASA
jgi:hypothetical protein